MLLGARFAMEGHHATRVLPNRTAGDSDGRGVEHWRDVSLASLRIEGLHGLYDASGDSSPLAE